MAGDGNPLEKETGDVQQMKNVFEGNDRENKDAQQLEGVGIPAEHVENTKLFDDVGFNVGQICTEMNDPKYSQYKEEVKSNLKEESSSKADNPDIPYELNDFEKGYQVVLIKTSCQRIIDDRLEGKQIDSDDELDCIDEMEGMLFDSFAEFEEVFLSLDNQDPKEIGLKFNEALENLKTVLDFIETTQGKRGATNASLARQLRSLSGEQNKNTKKFFEKAKNTISQFNKDAIAKQLKLSREQNPDELNEKSHEESADDILDLLSDVSETHSDAK